MSSIRERKILIPIFVVGFLLRVSICFLSGLPHVHEDTPEYYQQAGALLSGSYINFFPNGYPLLIAIAKLIAGNYSNTFLLWCNIFFSTLTIWFIFDIGKRVFSDSGIALLAAAILALFPEQINYVRWLTTEVSTAFLLLAAWYCYCREQNLRSGILFALAIFVRTNIAPIAFLLLILRLARDRKIPWRLTAGLILPLLLICIYCNKKTGEFSISGNNQINILYAVTAKGDYVDFRLNLKHPEINTTGKAVKMYVDHMLNEPMEFLSQKCANYWELWGFYHPSARIYRSAGSRFLLGAGNFILIVFGLAGWWLHRRMFNVNLLLLPFLTITAIHVILFALTRYTYPVEPFMILLAASAIIRIKPTL
jgi:hypothetical protein